MTHRRKRPLSLFQELKRRNVFRVALAYAVLSWLLLQVSDVLVDALELPATWSKALIALLLIGLIPALIFSWVYEMTPEGLKRESEVDHDQSITHETAHKLNIAVIFMLALAIALFAVDRFVRTPENVAAPPVIATPAATAPETDQGVAVVAVLPLQTLSTEEEGRFLASGLHDDLLTRLARLDAFRVISRTSVMEYADTTKNLRQIGAELGAGYILEGGLQAIGGRVRINAQLIDAATDEHLWAQTFDRELTTANLFNVQSDIATAIAEAAHAVLSPRDAEVLDTVPTQNLEAYRAYLKGLDTAGDLSKPGMTATLDSFREAVALDPEFADAWALLSKAYLRLFWEEGGEKDSDPDFALRDTGLDALERAQGLDPAGLQTLMAEAYYHYYGFRDYSKALIALGRAEAIAPNDTRVISLRGFLLRRLGRMDEAANALLRALLTAPIDRPLLRETTTTLGLAGRCREASNMASRALERYPDHAGILQWAARARLLCEDDPKEAQRLAEQINVTTVLELDAVVYFHVYAGDFPAAIRFLETLDKKWLGDPLTRLDIENNLAWLYRETGQPEAAALALRSAGEAAADIDRAGTLALARQAMTAALRSDIPATLELGRRSLASMPEDAFAELGLRYEVIKAYAIAGALDEALDELDTLLAKPGGRFITPVMIDPYLAEVRKLPGFKQ
jgi:TolB-like protein